MDFGICEGGGVLEPIFHGYEGQLRFGEVKSYIQIFFTVKGINISNPYIVQELGVLKITIYLKLYILKELKGKII